MEPRFPIPRPFVCEQIVQWTAAPAIINNSWGDGIEVLNVNPFQWSFNSWINNPFGCQELPDGRELYSMHCKVQGLAFQFQENAEKIKPFLNEENFQKLVLFSKKINSLMNGAFLNTRLNDTDEVKALNDSISYCQNTVADKLREALCQVATNESLKSKLIKLGLNAEEAQEIVSARASFETEQIATVQFERILKKHINADNVPLSNELNNWNATITRPKYQWSQRLELPVSIDPKIMGSYFQDFKILKNQLDAAFPSSVLIDELKERSTPNTPHVPIRLSQAEIKLLCNDLMHLASKIGREVCKDLHHWNQKGGIQGRTHAALLARQPGFGTVDKSGGAAWMIIAFILLPSAFHKIISLPYYLEGAGVTEDEMHPELRYNLRQLPSNWVDDFYHNENSEQHLWLQAYEMFRNEIIGLCGKGSFEDNWAALVSEDDRLTAWLTKPDANNRFPSSGGGYPTIT